MNKVRARKVPSGRSCWGCKAKRLVCDFEQPSCNKCKARGVECPGYDKKPLVWIPDGQVKSCGRRHRQEQLVPCRVPGMLGRAWIDSCRPFEVVTYYNSCIAPDAVCAADAWGPEDQHYIPLEFARDIPEAALSSLTCIVLGHRILQSQDDAYRVQLSYRLRGCRSNAIRAVSRQISAGELAKDDDTLWAVLLLFLADVQQALTFDWRPHLDGASTLIDLRGGMSSFALSTNNFKQVVLYYILADVMGRTTSPSMTLEKAEAHLRLTQLIPELYHNGMRTSCPCPPELFQYIILVNYQRALLNEMDVTEEIRRNTAMNILDQINAFCPEDWVHETFGTQSGCSPSEGSSRVNMLSGWLYLASSYQCAAAVYCLGALLNGHRRTEAEGADVLSPLETDDLSRLKIDELPQDGMQRAYHAVLMYYLTQMMRLDGEGSGYGKLAVWPIVIAGMGVPQGDEGSKEFIRRHLRAASSVLGTSSTLVAINVLEKIWT
ncbi:C6 zinc finger domain-containing protein [Pochonia chlamydosporia 170]|uniref:C6 zinc finger domain-containing protein n=1 Tax=Pochonia chlamydosporia 170 TaxID=1380566 RepID=A0A179FLH3_METCM|nr:C6 zinc finger domain-containing protein [Pochonia chlamydosporia 170]OAQ66070.2 C6 zinc finger domain-containing protein [Pochonia chlamydosporia 170]